MTVARVECKECGADFLHLEKHLSRIHRLTLEDYLDRYGEDVPYMSSDLLEALEKKSPERKGSKSFAHLIRVGDIRLTREQGEPSETFKRPDHYSYPKQGSAASAAERFARAFKYKKHTFVYGPAGCGKSALVRALTHDMNLEASHYPMRAGLDTELYLGKEAVVIDEATNLNVTRFIEGKLLRDLRGREGKDGIIRGVVILIDDIDRAPAQYHEVLRHVLEDNARNVFIPELGVNVEIHPDTRIIATANSAGRGDSAGYYSSVEEMDESILDRFQRAVEYHFLEPEEEEGILQNKFPLIRDTAPHIFKEVLDVAGDIRLMIDNNDIYASFSHRRLVQWLESATELFTEDSSKDPQEVLKESAKDWLDWYDHATRFSVLDSVISTRIG
jgi:MoxR-like ATPase